MNGHIKNGQLTIDQDLESLKKQRDEIQEIIDRIELKKELELLHNHIDKNPQKFFTIQSYDNEALEFLENKIQGKFIKILVD